MIGRRTIAGLLLLFGCAFCAFTASGAAAAGTTAFTCVEGQGEKDFSDAHCDKQVKAGEGSFGHVSIASGTSTEITLTNEKTTEETKAAQPFILTGTVSSLSLVIECKTVGGSGALTNGEEKATMQATGTALIESTGCVITNQPNCAVKGGAITWDASFKTFGTESAMGLEFTPKSGVHFGSWTLIDNGAKSCAVKNTFTIDGSFQATPGGTSQGKGATLKVTEATSKSLTWGGNPYTLTGAITWRMKAGNPITFTTG